MQKSLVVLSDLLYLHENLRVMESLFKRHQILISQVSTKIVRNMQNSIKWDKQLVAIKGSRGVGKTTLIRQHIKSRYGEMPGEALYCTMDSL